MSSDDEVREEKELDLSSQDVVTKYKSAAEIINGKPRLSKLSLAVVSVACETILVCLAEK